VVKNKREKFLKVLGFKRVGEQTRESLYLPNCVAKKGKKGHAIRGLKKNQDFMKPGVGERLRLQTRLEKENASFPQVKSK